MADDKPVKNDVLLMAGTRKGAFLFWSSPERTDWGRSFHHEGWMVHAMNYDLRDGSIYAATNSEVYGALVQRSTDLGGSWDKRNKGLDFGEGSEERVRKVWSIEAGHAAHPGRMYAGVEKAGLFMSDDHGANWQPVSGLNEHPSSEHWAPGGGGLILHTILVDPADENILYAGISTGGLYRSDDGGATWAPKNEGVRADFLPDPHPEVGQCVHKLALHPGEPGLLYQQNHCGVYRSEDKGDHWIEITGGLPSEFGFPIGLDPHDPNTIFVVPLVEPGNRVIPDGEMTVWRSRDRGKNWEARRDGLPDGAYLTILRDAMAVDAAKPCGIYVGTTTGQVFQSRDEGETWSLMANYLPPVYSLSAAIVQ